MLKHQDKGTSVLPDITYPTIEPVPEGTTRPFWSVMIPAYNNAEYLVKTLNSVLGQDPGPDTMQIAVIDDCSTEGDPEAAVRDIGKGRVDFFRQPENVGAPANFTTCIRRARGQWVHILHSDDEVLPHFYLKYREIIETYDCSMVLGRSIFIDEDNFWRSISRPLQKKEGLLDNAQFILSIGNDARTPSVVVARKAYEIVGGYHEKLIHCADWDMWAKVAAHGPVCYVPQPYTLYREHPASDTTKLAMSGLDITDTLQALRIIASRFQDPHKKREVQSLGRMWIGFNCLYQGLMLILDGQAKSALRHLAFGLKFSPLFFRNWRHFKKLLF